MKGGRGVLVDPSMPVGVRSDEVPLGYGTVDQFGIFVRDPTQEVAVGFHRLAF
jgi:hypothetical protein